MSEPVSFIVYGQPVPQGSKRAFHGKIVDVSGARLRSYRQDIHLTALQEMGGRPAFLGPVSVWASFHMPRPKSHYGTGKNAAKRKDGLPSAPAKTPDIDKLGRAVLDALTGACFRDDAQVVGLRLSKVWADHSDTATMISVLPL